jgi:hypothetical protein
VPPVHGERPCDASKLFVRLERLIRQVAGLLRAQKCVLMLASDIIFIPIAAALIFWSVAAR